MSLNNMSLGSTVIRQFQYKLKAYNGVLSSLVVIQIIAILFSLNGNASFSSGGSGVSIHATVYTNVTVIIFTILWIIAHSVMMSTKAEREHGFTFVSNHTSNHLSNALFILLASVIAGTTTILAGFLLRVIVYFFNETSPVLDANVHYELSDIFIGIFSMIFYLILIGSVGYVLGTVSQLHRTLPYLLPVLLIGVFIWLVQRDPELIGRIVAFYFQEANAFLFILKVSVTSVVCFMTSILLTKRLEARQ
ncbi:hypothetical protein ACDX78_03805 [Virgibacillus oceani]